MNKLKEIYDKFLHKHKGQKLELLPSVKVTYIVKRIRVKPYIQTFGSRVGDGEEKHRNNHVNCKIAVISIL